MTESSCEARLRLAGGKSANKTYLLKEGRNLIGRYDPAGKVQPEVDLEDVDVDAKVSRQHAVIELRDGTAFVRDLGSLNGTIVNRGDKLNRDQEIELSSGDQVTVGKTTLFFELGPFSQPCPEISA